jgi:hypothetical protein
VLAGRDDPDARRLFRAVEEAKAMHDSSTRYGTVDFRPNPQYIRERNNMKIKADSFDQTKYVIGDFWADQGYWKLLWHPPSSVR